MTRTFNNISQYIEYTKMITYKYISNVSTNTGYIEHTILKFVNLNSTNAQWKIHNDKILFYKRPLGITRFYGLGII